ncbi:MAG: M20/M25/M40 family metallo-hydrolase [Thermoplasmata archaeon]|nr:MAG: M20/M25/M40 family metallo-hydrolase [Thermoplasmata archaeon]
MDVIELTKKLVSIKSVTGSEHEIAEYIASRLDSADVTVQDVDGHGPNVIARHIPQPEEPIILLNCHMDTVKVMRGWQSDPFEPITEGNRLYGLGSCDMKAGVAIAMEAFMRSMGSDRNIIFTAVSDEEGNSKGAFTLKEKLQKEIGRESLGEALCLIPEDTDELIKLGARGRYVVEITVTGCSAHGATPECGVNAISAGARILAELDRLPLRSHTLLGSGSICVLKISGGGDTLSVPDECKIRVDRHTVCGEGREQIMTDFEMLLGEMNLNCKYEISWMDRDTPFLEAYMVDRQSPWAEKFLDAYRRFYSKEPRIAYGRSVGDFNVFGNIMPTIVFGPEGENVHGPNECVYLDSITRCRDFYNDFLEGF